MMKDGMLKESGNKNIYFYFLNEGGEGKDCS